MHDEVAQALAEARELTAEVAEALACGGTEAAAPLVWEWRGVLFRVRFARHRLERPRLQPAPVQQPAPAGTTAQQVFAASAVAVGSVLVLVAALLGLWLLVALDAHRHRRGLDSAPPVTTARAFAFTTCKPDARR